MSRYDGGLRLYQGDGHYWRGNDISEEPDWQRWDEKGGELEVGSAADWVCALHRYLCLFVTLYQTGWWVSTATQIRLEYIDACLLSVCL